MSIIPPKSVSSGGSRTPLGTATKQTPFPNENTVPKASFTKQGKASKFNQSKQVQKTTGEKSPSDSEVDERETPPVKPKTKIGK